MEMHQVRYFLAVAETRNFTRAADDCHVSQPSLSRAIKLLEAELGGDLFRRERPQAQLTSLGEYMYPLLRQCYESALGARSLAQAIRKRAVGSLSLAVSASVDPGVVAPHIAALKRQFVRLQVRLMRGRGEELVEMLKAGEAELAVAEGSLEAQWERIDRWPLFTEPLRLVVGHGHRLANRAEVEAEELRDEPLILRLHAESLAEVIGVCRDAGIAPEACDEIASDADFVELLRAGVGAGLAPASLAARAELPGLEVRGVALERTVSLYGVAGRQRSAAAGAVMKMLRSHDWAAEGWGATAARSEAPTFAALKERPKVSSA